MHTCFMQSRLPGIVARRARGERAPEKEPLQVRIPANLKRQFKSHAALRGMEPNELFVEIWSHYERTVIHKLDSAEAPQ